MKNIRELNKEGTKFRWGEAHNKEFLEMKEHLKQVCKIHTYDHDLPLELYCNELVHREARACSCGVWAAEDQVLHLQGPKGDCLH